ncbi:MAG: hypothetical protein QY314_04715 [Candidatus Dojkabacteria bacterium]|nr:MAG: hypothetical protein QY314_04715 [Candidatus Dojkabacteria bacterium]
MPRKRRKSKKNDLKSFLSDYLMQIPPTTDLLPCEGCGSCLFGEYHYEDHLEGKTFWLTEVYRPLKEKGVLPNVKIGVEISPKRTRYRNKMDFVAYDGKIGLRKGGFANVYDVMDSCLAPEFMSEVLAAFRKWQEFPYYDLQNHTGIIRYFVVRSSEHEGNMQYMLTLVVKNIPQHLPQSLLQFMKDEGIYDKFTVIAIAQQPTKSDVSFSDDLTFLKGTHIEYDLSVHEKTYTFAITPNAFFQSNAKMYEIVLEDMAQSLKKYLPEGEIILYDLYGGIGSIGISLSQFASKIINIEISQENCALAERNAIINKVNNYTVICSDVTKELGKIEFTKGSVIVFDPPRVGIGEKALQQFLSLESLPQVILYMSCNPLTQVLDLDILSSHYEIVSVKGYDMFPFTGHIEALVVLIKKPE